MSPNKGERLVGVSRPGDENDAKPVTILEKLYTERRLQAGVLALVFVYYGIVLFNAGIAAHDGPINLTFNSMLANLCHGRFDVDPAIIGNEGFLRNGHVYAYWGIFCALLRIPLLLTNRLDLDVTTLSCLIAVCLCCTAKLQTILLVRNSTTRSPSSNLAISMMVLYVLFGGSAVGYLKSSIYQEVDFWSAALCAIFVYASVKGIIERHYSFATLMMMSCAAGLTLLTRVSTGIGTCLAFGLLSVVLVTRGAFGNDRERKCSVISLVLRHLVSEKIVIPIVVLGIFLLAAGTVNYFRWGSPFKFADHTLYIMNAYFPDRMPRTHLYGYFSIKRLPFGAIYYFFPIWVFHGPSGKLFFEATQFRLMDALELPPSSLFLTDLLPFCMMPFLFLYVRRRRCISFISKSTALAVGLAVPCLLMLTAISMNYRYRMDFYPEIDLLGILGLYAVSSDPEIGARFWALRKLLATATAISMASAFVVMILYKLSTWGPSQDLLHNGILHYYANELRNI